MQHKCMNLTKIIFNEDPRKLVLRYAMKEQVYTAVFHDTVGFYRHCCYTLSYLYLIFPDIQCGLMAHC